MQQAIPFAVPARDRAHVPFAAHGQAPRTVAGRALAETNDRARIDRAQWKQLPRPARERETKTFRVESGCTIRIIHSWADKERNEKSNKVFRFGSCHWFGNCDYLA